MGRVNPRCDKMKKFCGVAYPTVPTHVHSARRSWNCAGCSEGCFLSTVPTSTSLFIIDSNINNVLKYFPLDLSRISRCYRKDTSVSFSFLFYYHVNEVGLHDISLCSYSSKGCKMFSFSNIVSSKSGLFLILKRQSYVCSADRYKVRLKSILNWVFRVPINAVSETIRT